MRILVSNISTDGFLRAVSFISKFKFLCEAGYEASLNLKSMNCHANISMQVDLGPLTVLPWQSHSSSSRNSQRRSPSYYHRQRRCKIKKGNISHTPNSTASEPIIEVTDVEESFEEVMLIDAEDNCEVAGSFITDISSDENSDHPNLLCKGCLCESSSMEPYLCVNGVSFGTVSDFETTDTSLPSSEPYQEKTPEVLATTQDQDEAPTSTTVGTISLKEFQNYMEEFNASLGATLQNKIASIIGDP